MKKIYVIYKAELNYSRRLGFWRKRIYLLKSVHFKNTVTQSSFHSKPYDHFQNTSTDIKTKSADALLKMVIDLSEIRIA